MKHFSPNQFLMALGAGGIAVSGFAFLNYTIPHGKGLITYAQLHAQSFPVFQQFLYSFVEFYMILFTSIHLLLTVYLLARYRFWRKTKSHADLLNNPISNSSLLIPYISYFMTLNVVLAVVRYFFPILSDQLQAIMLPGLIAWAVLWVMLLQKSIALLAHSISQKFDPSQMNFSWLMYPFALGMATVTGTGIAALSANATFAHIAAFLSLISFTMGAFLLTIISVLLFKNAFSADKLPANPYLPGMLAVIPILTVFGISLFRYGHYFERHFNAHMGPYFMIVTTLTFAFQTWYLLFGGYLLKQYLLKDFPKEYHISQWGLICPLVAYAVMGSFVYATFVASPLLIAVIVSFTIGVIGLYLILLYRQFSCRRVGNPQGHTVLICE